MTPEELELKKEELALQRETLALERRKSTHSLIQILFGSLMLGCIGLFFNWESMVRSSHGGDRDFLADHLKEITEPDTNKRIAYLERLIAFRDKGLGALETELEQSKIDREAEAQSKRAEEARLKAENEAKAAKAEQEKAAAQKKLEEATKLAAIARQKEADRVKAASERHERFSDGLSGAGGRR